MGEAPPLAGALNLENLGEGEEIARFAQIVARHDA
jgi:hypothetical protein